ncbi:DUF1405 domain-containing protein [Rossellomorea vietnamensis]|uniref:DUF1405 domain-containing protein n=1 Tax=Rossellomorea vietnamensis TaxID=218284 RepID=A0A5D4MF64_9BACI|nr:DUF1405 domain-containing protein [Rossellomorea vietnamensis]TYS00530.1 DUF1405 domain-containing protein [Rossellomorea vietnamensis]
MIRLYSYLTHKSFLALLLAVNILGTIYGYIWYLPQLEKTAPHFWVFVPDSPTASLFFCFVIAALLMGRNWPLMEALAIITLFKYGIWAVVMNLLTLGVTGYLPWEGYMLIGSHFAMAVQGILYSPYYRVKTWHIIAAAVWTLHNDIIDYVFMQYPIYSQLHLYISEIGYFTFWLSLFSIFLCYFFTRKLERREIQPGR